MIQYAKFLSTVFLFLIFTNTANAAALPPQLPLQQECQIRMV
jgi:hypothetical protein